MVANMKYSKELIYHFTCDKCNLWWSIALESELNNRFKEWFCPWCGHKHKEKWHSTQIS